MSQYPKPPFGMSHFAIWGIPNQQMGYIFGTFMPQRQQPFYPLLPLIFPFLGTKIAYKTHVYYSLLVLETTH